MRRYNDEEWRRIYGSPERAAWVCSLPSVASGKRPCENAHVRNGGEGRKADYIWIVPLTWEEHRVELHQTLGSKSFEAKYGIDLAAKAREIQAQWEDHVRTHNPEELPW